MRSSFLPPLAAEGTTQLLFVSFSVNEAVDGELGRDAIGAGTAGTAGAVGAVGGSRGVREEEGRERCDHHPSHRPQASRLAEISTEYLDKRALRRVDGIFTRMVGMVLGPELCPPFRWKIPSGLL